MPGLWRGRAGGRTDRSLTANDDSFGSFFFLFLESFVVLRWPAAAEERVCQKQNNRTT